MTFEQKFLPFSAFGKILKKEHFLIKNRKVFKTDKNARKTPATLSTRKSFLSLTN
jgi:hypothetical protein